MTDWEAEDLLRNALAEFAATVEPRPALHLIRDRTAPADAPAETAQTSPPERTDSQ